MTKQELIKDIEELIENNAGIIEIFEYIYENSDFDPAEIIEEIEIV